MKLGEFKNSIMNQFCEMKGIKREFSVARTPQQNGVAERKNKTLIEATRTIPPLIDFMKPFGCPVTILNTRDHLGKFDGKADEGYFVGYSVVLQGTKLMVLQEQQITLLQVKLKRKKEPEQEYILIPLCTTDPLISQGPKDYEGDARIKPTEVDENEASDNSGKHDQEARSESKSTPVSTDGPSLDIAVPSTPVNNTVIFGNAYDGEDVEEEVDMNNGHTQEEGIDYDEVFAPVTRIQAIRLFLAYASFKDFIVYQMDVKSAFLYVKIEEEVYVCQPPGFEDPHFLDKVYKVEKALYGLHQAPRACQDKYMAEILKKFDFVSIKTVSTPMETNKALVKDEEDEDVDVHLYRLMIGSLMYLTASRPDIMFVVYACARFQVTPITLHFNAVKSIFRYLKGQPKLGLWYPRDSPFNLEAFSNSDYAGASLDRKSTTSGCQFLSKRLISWQCKKQIIVANSTTEAEYVAAANCCGQVLWIQNQMLDYGFNFMNTKIYIDNESTICIVKNPVFHSKTKHIEIRHHFIRDSYEKKLIQVIKIHTDQNVADLLTKAFDASRVKTAKFWATENVKMVNEVRQLQALIDKKKMIITKSSIRSDLHLEDAEDIDCLPTTTIFELAKMGLSAKSTAWNEFSSTMASLIICFATNQKFNMSKYIFNDMVKHLDGGVKFLLYPRFLQVFINQQLGDMSHHKEIYVNPSHTKKFFANMKRAGKDFSGRITPLFDTMMLQASEEVSEDSDHPTDSNQIPISMRKVYQHLHPVKDSMQANVFYGFLARRIESSNDSLGSQEDASKQGRRIEDIDTIGESKEKKIEGSEEKAKSSIMKSLGKKRAVEEQQQESPKRQKLGNDKETDKHEEVEANDLA
ncbi:putative ribonuclease H-like domain-containing protein [Tanacetum coccineum]